MADGDIQVEFQDCRNNLEKVPLLRNLYHQTQESKVPNDEEGDGDTNLDKSLQRLDFFLSLLGFNQFSLRSFVVSWACFLVVGIFLPSVILELSNCPGCEKGQIKSFEIGILASQGCLAAASLICLSHNLRKYGVRKFLFVDRYSGHVERFSAQYIGKISDSIRLLALWVLPCFCLKTGREILRLMYVRHESWWQSAAILLSLVVSWTYVTTIILSGCILFHLVCSLQVIHFDDYGKLLEREHDVVALLQEHARLRYNLSKISHRFRVYLLTQFVIVTVAQFVILFQTTGYNGVIDIINGGDFAVSSIVQVVGIILCLNAAAKISHRAQGIGALASRWHAFMTANANGTPLGRTNSIENSEAAGNVGSLHANYSESDLESLDFTAVPSNTQLASYMSSYHKRLALVMYLQANPGGITIFGWTVDRGLINTIFFLELSLVTFVLGQTVVITPN